LLLVLIAFCRSPYVAIVRHLPFDPRLHLGAPRRLTTLGLPEGRLFGAIALLLAALLIALAEKRIQLPLHVLAGSEIAVQCRPYRCFVCHLHDLIQIPVHEPR
jgi:hypothetical protein